MKSYFTFLLLIFICVYQSYSQAPAGYYNSANGLTGPALQQALHDIIDNHTSKSYDALWTSFGSTDLKPSTSTIWDIYSDIPGGTPPYEYTWKTDQCGTYTTEGTCYNREHSFPQEWFGGSSPMYTDLFHLYPTDGKVNGVRSNFSYGEVASATTTTLNGSKLGNCSYPGYSAKVFEPIDEYKGDLARSYFYMATRYLNEDSGWPCKTDSTLSASNLGSQLKPWALAMMLEWNASDPVSQKEIDRNNAIYTIQTNRNPYIDNPDYATLIWGAITPTLSAVPSILSGFSYFEGNGPSSSLSFSLSGAGLTGFPSNIIVNAPANYEVSKDNSTFSNSLNIPYTSEYLMSTPIYVRLKAGLIINSYTNENITISGGGASDLLIPCNGSVSAETIGTSKIIITEVVDASAYLASYVEIHNAGNAAENITGWQLFENGASVATVSGVTLQPCDYMIFIRGTLTDLQTLYGTYSGQYYMASTGLIANGVDYFELKNTSGTIVDKAGSSTSTTTQNFAYERIDANSDGTVIATDWNQMTDRNLSTPGKDNLLALTNENCGTITTSPKLTVSTSSLTGFSYISGSGPSSSQMYNLSGTDLIGFPSNITVTAPVNYEISTNNSTFSASVSVAYSTATLSSTPIYVRLKSGLVTGTYNSQNVVNSGGGASSINVICSGEVTASSNPMLTISVSALSNFSYETGSGPSSSQFFNLSGSNLLSYPSNIVVNVSSNFEISLDNVSFSSTLNIPYTSATLSETPIYARLKAGLNVAAYSSEVITISGGGASQVNLMCNGVVTDVIVVVNCVTETFTNIPADSPSSYLARTWTGDDGSAWTATSARTDQLITGKAITFKNGIITSPSISGGISSLTLTTKFPFIESSGSLTIAVNGNTIGTVLFSEMTGITPITKTFSDINIEGNIVVTITSATARFSIDDLSWTCYNTLGIVDELESENSFIIFPNPNDGNFSIKKINNEQISNVVIRDITGKSIFSNMNENLKEFNLNLTSGIYFIEFQTKNKTITKRFVVK